MLDFYGIALFVKIAYGRSDSKLYFLEHLDRQFYLNLGTNWYIKILFSILDIYPIRIA